MFSSNFIHFIMPSINPLFFCFCILSNFLNIVGWLTWAVSPVVPVDLIFLFLSICFWVSDVNQESNLAQHNTLNTDCFKFSFLLFVGSEIMLFFSFFWLMFSNEFCPNPEIAMSWEHSWFSLSPKSVPLFNSVILLTSSITLTLFHFDTLCSHKSALFLILTIILGMYFLSIQFIEYKNNKISMSDASSVSTFYILTMFHGCHVMVGTLFLIFVTIFFYIKEITSMKNIVMDSSILYWHFVDVVWLFLFTFLYVWPKV